MKCVWILSLLLLNVALIDACGVHDSELRGAMMDKAGGFEDDIDRMVDPVPGGWAPGDGPRDRKMDPVPVGLAPGYGPRGRMMDHKTPS